MGCREKEPKKWRIRWVFERYSGLCGPKQMGARMKMLGRGRAVEEEYDYPEKP